MTRVGDRSAGVRALLGRPGFRHLLVGQTVSGFGDWMATVAFMALVLDVTGSSAAVGVILVLRLAPAAIAGPLATRVVRRWNRRRTMLAMDLARVGVVLAVPVIAAVWWIYLWAFVLEVAGLIFLPARDAAVPELAGGESLPLANGLVMGSSYGTIPLGAGAFAALSALSTGGGHGHSQATYWAVFAVDAATFLVSFLAIWRIRDFDSARFEQAAHSEEHSSFTDAFRLEEVRTAAPVALVVAVGLGALFSLGIVFVRHVLGASNADFSLLIALFGAGAALGLVVVRTVDGPRLTLAKWAVMGQGLTVAGMSLAPDLGVAFLGAVCFGAATTVALTSAVSELQERLAGQQRVMAFATFHVAIRGGLAAAAVLAGLVADRIRGVAWPVIGHLPPARLVLLGSGLVVLIAGGVLTRRLASLPDAHERPGGGP